MEKTGRNLLADVIRGFAMVVVISLHCMMTGNGAAYTEQSLFFSDRLYLFEQTFVMPLFMVISGYFSWKGISFADTPQKRFVLLKQKAIYLLFPCIAWAGIDCVVMLLFQHYRPISICNLLMTYLYRFFTDFWTLWAIFGGIVITLFIHHWFKDSILAYFILFLLMFFTPDGLNFMAYKFVYPFFLVGFYTRANQDKILHYKIVQQIRQQKFVGMFIILLLGILYFAMFHFYTADSMIYLTGYKLLGKDYLVQLKLDGYRFFIGLVGSVFWILVWMQLYKLPLKHIFHILQYIGKMSLGIYILSSYVLVYGLSPLTKNVNASYGLNLIETVGVIASICVILEAVKRIKGINLIMGVKGK